MEGIKLITPMLLDYEGVILNRVAGGTFNFTSETMSFNRKQR